MNIFRSDFWPPIQGGWETLEGTFVALENLMVTLGVSDSVAREAIANDDDGLLSELLEELFEGKNYAPPERVVWFSPKRIKDAPKEIINLKGYYAYWPTEKWKSTPALSKILGNSNAIGPVRLSYKYSRFIPSGAGLVIWLSALIIFALWLTVR